MNNDKDCLINHKLSTHPRGNHHSLSDSRDRSKKEGGTFHEAEKIKVPTVSKNGFHVGHNELDAERPLETSKIKGKTICSPQFDASSTDGNSKGKNCSDSHGSTMSNTFDRCSIHKNSTANNLESGRIQKMTNKNISSQVCQRMGLMWDIMSWIQNNHSKHQT